MASGLLIDYLGSGVIASRPASLSLFAGSVGIWWATDTNILSVWNGSAWTNTTGGIPTGTGFTHITAGVQDAAAKLVDTADINNDQVTYAKMQNISTASKLLGRGDSGSGDPEEITIGSGLSMIGTTISATGGAAGVGAQINYARTVSTTTASTTDTSIPADATIPQNTEGVAYASLDTAITPTASSSLLEVEVIINVTSQSAAGSPRFAIFRDSTASAVAAGFSSISGVNGIGALVLRTVVAAGSTSATTFKLRWCASTGTAQLLQAGSVNYFGSTNVATMTVKEIKQ
jgi:hypothetical protein